MKKEVLKMTLRGALRDKKKRDRFGKFLKKVGVKGVAAARKTPAAARRARRESRAGLEFAKRVVAVPRETKEAFERERKAFRKAAFGKGRTKKKISRKRRQRRNPLFDFGD